MSPDIARRTGAFPQGGWSFIMAIVYCQLFSGEKLLADRLLVSIERETRPNEKAPECTFRVPVDQLKTIREHQPMRLEFPEKIARRLKIAEGNSLHIVTHQIHDRIAHFGEARASGG
jgi:hypothetical protein